MIPEGIPKDTKNVLDCIRDCVEKDFIADKAMRILETTENPYLLLMVAFRIECTQRLISIYDLYSPTVKRVMQIATKMAKKTKTQTPNINLNKHEYALRSSCIQGHERDPVVLWCEKILNKIQADYITLYGTPNVYPNMVASILAIFLGEDRCNFPTHTVWRSGPSHNLQLNNSVLVITEYPHTPFFVGPQIPVELIDFCIFTNFFSTRNRNPAIGFTDGLTYHNRIMWNIWSTFQNRVKNRIPTAIVPLRGYEKYIIDETQQEVGFSEKDFTVLEKLDFDLTFQGDTFGTYVFCYDRNVRFRHLHDNSALRVLNSILYHGASPDVLVPGRKKPTTLRQEVTKKLPTSRKIFQRHDNWRKRSGLLKLREQRRFETQRLTGSQFIRSRKLKLEP